MSVVSMSSCKTAWDATLLTRFMWILNAFFFSISFDMAVPVFSLCFSISISMPDSRLVLAATTEKRRAQRSWRLADRSGSRWWLCAWGLWRRFASCFAPRFGCGCAWSGSKSSPCASGHQFSMLWSTTARFVRHASQNLRGKHLRGKHRVDLKRRRTFDRLLNAVRFGPTPCQ